jgi:hypothetical protein
MYRFCGARSERNSSGVNAIRQTRSLLASYLLNLKRGPESVRDMMVSDLRCWLDLGAVQQAADLLIVLRQYLSEYPEARLMRHSGGQKDLPALTPIRH